MRQLNLGNGANWQLKHSANIVAMQVPLSNGKYLHNPIGEVKVPFLLDKYVYAILIGTTKPAGAKWKFGGYVKQSIHIGISNGGGQDAATNTRQPLFLFHNNVVFFPAITAEFSMSIIVPDWFTDVDLNIWEYIGEDNDTVEQRLVAIDAKLQQLLGY